MGKIEPGQIRQIEQIKPIEEIEQTKSTEQIEETNETKSIEQIEETEQTEETKSTEQIEGIKEIEVTEQTKLTEQSTEQIEQIEQIEGIEQIKQTEAIDPAEREKGAKRPNATKLTKEARQTKRVKQFKKAWETARITVITFLAAAFAILFLMPIVLTFTNSFMSSSEISSNYGSVFAMNENGGKVYIAEKVNLKFIPDIVSFSQYITVLLKSPEYLLKFWNSVILVGPIVIFQLAVASLAAYGFARYTGKLRSIIFFSYVILMLMPYQVTLVPNYLVASWLKLLDSYWAIWLPGIFSPFAVYLLTKFMKRIPYSMIEAAQIDGAGEWQIFTKVCLPLCKGALCSAAILVFIDYWNMVEQPLILLSDAETHPLSVFLSKINAGEVGLAFAVATIYMVPSLLVFLYGEEYLVDGITYQGGVKG